MYPELVTRSDLEVFLPPIGGQTVYIFGDAARPGRSGRRADRARARRVQRLRRVRLRHLHLPALPHARHRGMHPGRAARRRRPGGLLAQGGPRARRGDQVPGLQRAQAPGGRRHRRPVLRPHRVRGRRAGHALPGADARRAALAGHPQDPPPGVDEQHEVRRHHRLGHRGRRAREHPRRADPGRRAGRDRRQDGRRLLHARPGARRRRTEEGQGPGADRDDGGIDVRPIADRPGRRGRRAAHHDRRARARAVSCCTAHARASRAWFTVDDDALHGGGGRSRRRHPRALPRPAHPVPQPLAPLRGRRRRPQGRARRAAGAAMPPSAATP